MMNRPTTPAPAPTPGLDRREVVAAVLADRGDLLVVAGLGAPSWDVAAVGDHDLNFPLWGAMGGAAMVGLGLALAQPERRVVVITGDGDALMGLTAFSTIGAAAPANLGLVVLDNERYGETGMQTTSTAPEAGRGHTDLAGVALACGWPIALTLRSAVDIEQGVDAVRRQPGPAAAVFKVAPDTPPQVVPPRDGVLLVERFRTALA